MAINDVAREYVYQNFAVEGVDPNNHSSSEKTRLNDLVVRYKILDRFFLYSVTNHAFDRQTNRRIEFSLLDRICIPCSALKILKIVIISSWILHIYLYLSPFGSDFLTQIVLW